MCGVPKTVVRDSHVRETVRPFMLDSRPVNNAEWRAFCEATRRETPPWMFKRGFEHPDQPVVGVSADEARAFARCQTFNPRKPPLPIAIPLSSIASRL
jgi:formylglycine-generating enzyme required for sulfatase activity